MRTATFYGCPAIMLVLLVGQPLSSFVQAAGPPASARSVWDEGPPQRNSASGSDVRIVAAADDAPHSDARSRSPGSIFGKVVQADGQVVAAEYRTSEPRTLQPPAGARPARRGDLQPSLRAASERSLNAANKAPARASAAGGGTSRTSTAASADQLIRKANASATTANSEDDFGRVIRACQQAITLERQGVAADYAKQLASWAFNRRGQIRVDAGRDDEAMADFQWAVRLDPQRWRAVHNRGVLLAQAGQFEQAFEDFNRTATLNPRYAKAYSNRAALFIVAGELLPALQDYRRATELDPRLAVAYRGQARVCHMLGKFDEALAHFDAAIRLAADDAYAVACRADLLTDMGRYSEAANEYHRAIQIDSRLSQAHGSFAWLLATCPDASVRNPELAVKHAETAMRLEPEPDAINFDTLAAAQASAGDFRAAMQTIRRAIELAPQQERLAYQDRLELYRHARPFRIEPVQTVQQAGYAH